MTSAQLPPLTTHEEDELKSALARIVPATADTVTVDDLLMRWSVLIGEVERGYKLTAYDYTNDLSARDRLEKLSTLLSPELRGKLMNVLAPLDERFVSATETTTHPLSDHPHMWWRRIPRKRDPEFDETM